MSSDRDEALRSAVRELLGELLPRTNGAGADTPARADDIVPAVPAPPVAAVLRPSTWSAPAAPGEVIGEGDARGAPAAAAITAATTGGAEAVRIDDDVDLNGFARALAERLQDPGTRDAIRTGHLRFTLRRSGAAVRNEGDVAQTAGAPVAPTTIRTVTGPVTERTIRSAAAEGARLVLAPGAVLTPLARDCARSLGVKIERERRC